MGFAQLVHLLSAVIWVGGMFFAYVVLRPAAVEILGPPERLRLWRRVFERFFKWVWLAVAVLLLSGFFMIHLYGGLFHVRGHIQLMLGTGLAMMAIYAYLFFVQYPKLGARVAAEEWPQAGATLVTIRKIIAVNLTLGVLTIGIASVGRWM